jgi:16S rRNA (uracil1498-N3)-methyltransferase
MARRRFLVDRICGDTAELRGDDARHVSRVLRAAPGRQYEISDGTTVYLAEISAVEGSRVVFRTLQPLAGQPLSVHLTVYAALVKFDRFEWIVEKATELGVEALVPIHAARSEKGLREAAAKRVERWRRIARESSQQARRLRPPAIGEPQILSAALAAPAAWRYFLDERPGAPPLLATLPVPEQRRSADSIALLTGPEGGWTEPERGVAQAAAWQPVSLGPLILRAETAAIAAAALLLHAWWVRQLE